MKVLNCIQSEECQVDAMYECEVKGGLLCANHAHSSWCCRWITEGNRQALTRKATLGDRFFTRCSVCSDVAKSFCLGSTSCFCMGHQHMSTCCKPIELKDDHLEVQCRRPEACDGDVSLDKCNNLPLFFCSIQRMFFCAVHNHINTKTGGFVCCVKLNTESVEEWPQIQEVKPKMDAHQAKKMICEASGCVEAAVLILRKNIKNQLVAFHAFCHLHVNEAIGVVEDIATDVKREYFDEIMTKTVEDERSPGPSVVEGTLP
jgi:hypothetical protein